MKKAVNNFSALGIDVETGGLFPGKNELLSIGMIAIVGGKVVGELEIPIYLGTLLVEDAALRVNKIDMVKHKKKAIHPKEAAEKVLAFICEHFPDNKPRTFGHMISNFDDRWMKWLFETAQIKFGQVKYKKFAKRKKDQVIEWETLIDKKYIDTAGLSNFLEMAGKIELRWGSLDEILRHFGVDIPEDRHTALSDIRLTAIVLDRFLSLVKK